MTLVSSAAPGAGGFTGNDFVSAAPASVGLLAGGAVCGVAAIVVAVLVLRKYGFSRAEVMKNVRSASLRLGIAVVLLGLGVTMLVVGQPVSREAASASSTASFVKWASSRYAVTLDSASAQAILSGQTSAAAVKGTTNQVHATLQGGALFLYDASGTEVNPRTKNATSGTQGG